MASTRIASGYVTIVDLNDGKSISAYTNPTKGVTQIYNPDTKTYTPDYMETPNVLKPVILVSGLTSDQIGACKNFVWKLNGNELNPEALPEGITLSSGEHNTLTIGANIPPDKNFYEIEWSGTYVDDQFVETPIKGAKTISLTKSGGSMALVQIECPDGNTFDQGTAGIKSLRAIARLFRGATQDKTVQSMAWQYLNMSNNDTEPWDPVPENTGKVHSVLSNGESTLYVEADDVLNFQTFRCVVQDQDESTDVFSNIVTFYDATDPYTVEVYTETGDKIQNGKGSTTAYARVIRDGEVIEDTKDFTMVNGQPAEKPESQAKFNYVWTKFDRTGEQKMWNEGETDASYNRTTPACTVTAGEVTGRITVFCTVHRK